MARARRVESWNHTSHIVAAIFNANRGPDDPQLKPAVFHPYAKDKDKRSAVKSKGIPLRAENIAMLNVFLQQQKR